MKQISYKDTYLFEIDKNEIEIRTNTQDANSRYSWNVDRHSNAEYELHILLEGECKVGINNTSFTMSKGNCVLIPPDFYHYSKTLTDKIEHFNFSFSLKKGKIAEYFVNNIKDYLIVNLNSSIEQLCLLYQKEYENSGIFNYDYRKTILIQLFIEFLRIININIVQMQLNNNKNPIDIIDQFFDQYHYKNGMEDYLAKELSISKRQLERYIQQYYGMSYRQKLIETRLEHSKWLLINSELSIQKISKIVGYSSTSSFFNMFKKENKMSPQKYRKQKRGQ